MKEISALALRASCRVEISWPGGGFWDLIRSLYWLLASSTRFCDGDLKIPGTVHIIYPCKFGGKNAPNVSFYENALIKLKYMSVYS